MSKSNGKIRVLFVCMGNICRSPAAQGTFEHAVITHGLSEYFYIDSAGTHAYHTGESPNVNARQVAKSYDIELNHKARQFTGIDYINFDYIFPMDHDNQKGVLNLARHNSDRQKVFKFRTFDPDKESPGDDPDVPDPYYGGIDGFQNVQEILNRTSDELLLWLLEKHQIPVPPSLKKN